MSSVTNSSETALLIVDVQNGFITPDTDHIPSMVEKLQHNYRTVVATQFCNMAGSFFRSLLHWDHVQRDSREFQLAFSPRSDAQIVVKPAYTCVDDVFLRFLHDHEIKQVDLCGIDTEICVTKCAVDLFEAGVVPVVLKEFCASTDGNAAHLTALQTLTRFIGRDQVR